MYIVCTQGGRGQKRSKNCIRLVPCVRTPPEWPWETGLEDDFFYCVPFCLRSVGSFEKCSRIYWLFFHGIELTQSPPLFHFFHRVKDSVSKKKWVRKIELVAIPGIHYHCLRHRDPEHSYFIVKDFLWGTPFKNHNGEVIDLQLNMIVGILLRL